MLGFFLLIPLIGVAIAAKLFFDGQHGKATMMIVFTVILSLLVHPTSLGGIRSMTEGLLTDPINDTEEPSNSSEAPSETPSPTPEPTPTDSSPPPWEWIGFIVAGLIAAAVLILATIWLTKVGRRIIAKRKIAKRKAIERQKLHDRHRENWSELLAKEKTLGSRWLQYEDSPELSLRYPIMRQLNDPKIAPVIEAMGKAKAYRTNEPPSLDENPVETDYAKAVIEFERALDEAERYAKKVRWNNFSPKERKKAHKALNLLSLAMDTNNYPAERKTAYKRVARLMEDLMIPIPQRSLFAIEESLGQLELTA